LLDGNPLHFARVKAAFGIWLEINRKIRISKIVLDFTISSLLFNLRKAALLMENSRNRAALLLLWSLAVSVPVAVRGQQELARIRFTTLSKSTAGGLKSDLVRDIEQDLGGYVWLATDRGLCRFDGWETIHYLHDPSSPASLSSDQLTAVATPLETRGALWIGTSSSGLMKFDPRSGEAVWIQKGTERGEGLLSNHITALAITEDKHLWIGTDAGLNVLDLATETLAVAEGPLASASVASLSTFGGGEIWAGTAAGELHQWSRKERSFAKTWSTSVPVTSVAVDPRSVLWIGTAGQGLHRRLSDGAEPLPVPLDGRGTVTSLWIDSNGDLWVGTTNGLGLLDRANDDFVWFNHHSRHADSLADDHVRAIFEDKSRMLWVATEGGGTSRFSLDRQWFPHIRHQAGRRDGLPHPSVRAFAGEGDGRFWIATGEGLARWDTDRGSFLPPPADEALAGANLSALLLDREGALWMGTRGSGLLVLAKDGSVEVHRSQGNGPGPLSHDNISALLEDREGRVLVGTLGGGLLRHDRETGVFARLDKGTEGAAFIDSLAEDAEGNLWVSANSGLHLLPAGGDALATLREVFPQARNPSSTRVATVLPDANGVVWIGTVDAGLDRLDTASGEISNFSSAVHGLPDDSVVALAKDQSNLLWVVTRQGVARLNAMQNQFRVFGDEDGLQRGGFSPGAIALDPEGRLLVGGQEGFNLIDPARLPALPRTPNPILTSFEYYGEPVVPTPGGILRREIAATDEIRLPHDQRLLFGFRFGNLDYRFPNRGHFRYRLEGYDEGWRSAGEDRKAVYAGLAPGRYEFRVQSSLDGRDWPDVTAKVRVVVTPPWWQTWWATTLGLLALVLITVAVTRLSIRSRVRSLRRREEIATAQLNKAEAALARQLQHRMLLERSSRELKGDGSGDRLFDDALRRIAEDFHADRCLALRLVEAEGGDADEGESGRLRPVGYWAPEGDEGLPEILAALARGGAFLDRVLGAKTSLALDGDDELPVALAKALGQGGKARLLAAPTGFLDSANGLILLVRSGSAAPWGEDETRLLDALSGQFGISLAEIATAEIEETYRRHLEEARHQAEVANRAKSDFLAKMTHELRTPLNAIIGFTEILSADPELGPRQRETLGIVNNSGEHLLDVINEILDLSKIEAGKMERNDEAFQLVPLLQSVQEMLSIKAKEKRIGFHFSARTGLPGEVVTDRSKLRQTLVNLVGNAIKFTAQGSVGVSVACEVAGEPFEAEGRMRRRIRVRFEVRDTGRGIKAEEIPRLFERYSQTETGRRSSEGTGLGLPIARSFVQLMGGDIEVESTFGEGTVFRFAIECDELAPAETAPAGLSVGLDEATARRIVGHHSPKGEVRILIAEDQVNNRLLLKRILGKAGFTLAEVENGREAVEKWGEWKPHLILMDEEMPVMRGSEATREIQSLAPADDKPVIVSLTAYALEQAKAEALEAGCSDFVAKPFRAHELFAVISKHLGVEYTFSEAA
jgi:signal transduction histidine kinase/ligand-binding sensor domain-containing protein/CheY-like chemotaxis protein